MACVPDSTGEELRRYLQEFAALRQEETPSLPVMLRTMALYLRYPVLAFLSGFSALGLALIPCAAAAFGFFLSFAVCCFAATFGGTGVLLALALMGIRCAVHRVDKPVTAQEISMERAHPGGSRAREQV
jgi:stage II sporulation protein M